MLNSTRQLPPRTLAWLRHGLTLFFLLAILSISNHLSGTFEQPGVLIMAALLGGYMALRTYEKTTLGREPKLGKRQLKKLLKQLQDDE